jgi:hypothetical protein
MSVLRLVPKPQQAPAETTAAPVAAAQHDTASAPAATTAPAADPLIPTIFHERWWLDAVTSGRYQAAEVHQGGKLIGWLPYVLSRRRGFQVSVMPTLTHLLGPALDEGRGSSNTRWLRRMDIAQELVGQLPPRLGLFSQTCHPDTMDVLAFQGLGFDSFVQFSAEIASNSPDDAWRQMRDKTRNVIRRAQERGQVHVLADPYEFQRFYAGNLSSVGDASYFDLSRIGSLFEAARARDQARIFAVRNSANAMIAAVFYVWDRRRLWYLLSSRDPRFTDNGAVSLLIWHGMQEAIRRGLVFDFDGIASSGAARFFAGFGAQIRPRYAVHRMSPALAAARGAAALLRGHFNRNHFIAP